MTRLFVVDVFPAPQNYVQKRGGEPGGPILRAVRYVPSATVTRVEKSKDVALGATDETAAAQVNPSTADGYMRNAQ